MKRFLRSMTATAVSLASLSACGEPDDPGPAESSASNRALCERLTDAPACVNEEPSACFDAALPNETVTLLNDDDPSSPFLGRQSFSAEPPYGSEECSGRYVYDVLTEGFVPTHSDPTQVAYIPLWVRNLWDLTDIDTAEECAEVVAEVAIRRELTSGVWEDWDAYRVIGSFKIGCETVVCGGGKWPEGRFNDVTGAPFTWVDIENVRRVRVVVSVHDGACRQRSISMGVAETWT